MKKKLRCKNCGTIIKDTEFSCPICHLKPDRTEEEKKEVEENLIHNNNKNMVYKAVILGLLLLGITLTFFGVIHLNDGGYCTDSNCSVKNLFMTVVGITLIISCSITLLRFWRK